MLMARPAVGVAELGGQDLHVAGQDDDLDVVLGHGVEDVAFDAGLGLGKHLIIMRCGC